MPLSKIQEWLKENPEWILCTELRNKINNLDKVRIILSKNEYGYLDPNGNYFKSLREVPSFVGIRQVVKAKHISFYK